MTPEICSCEPRLGGFVKVKATVGSGGRGPRAKGNPISTARSRGSQVMPVGPGRKPALEIVAPREPAVPMQWTNTGNGGPRLRDAYSQQPPRYMKIGGLWNSRLVCWARNSNAGCRGTTEMFIATHLS